VQGRAGKEPIGEANCTELEAAGEQHLVVETHDDLRRAAADVAHEHRAVVDTDRIQHPEVDEPGFLHARHDLDLDVRRFTNLLDELGSVLGFADGAGRDRAHLRIVRLGDSGEPLQALDAPLHRLLREFLHVAAAVAETDDFFLSRHHFEAAGNRFGDDQMEAVRADVQRGYEVTHSF